MICQLSEKVISSYIYSNNKKSENPLSSEIGKISYITSQTISALENEKRSLKQVVDNAVGFVNECIDECNHKLSSIRSYLRDTPAEIELTETQTVETRNKDGSASTKKVEKKKKVLNQNHYALKTMLAQAEKYKRELEKCLDECLEHYKDVRALETAINNFKISSEEAISFAYKVAESMCKHLNSLSAQGCVAQKSLKSAKEACGPFPAIYDNKGTVDIDGLREYIVNMESKLSECFHSADKLVMIADNLNSGWNDNVYIKFYNDTVDIRNNIAGVIKDLENINDALDLMYCRLKEYAEIIPEVKFESSYFVYKPVLLPWSGKINSTSKEMQI